MIKIYIGCHISISKGYENAGKLANEIGANTFQFFTRNPRGAKAKELDMSDIRKLKKLMEDNNFGPILAHAPYTLNMASYKEKTWEFAKMIILDDLKRLKKIPCKYYNLHPGNHIGKGIEFGIDRIAEVLNSVITEKEDTMILLETMSGKGTEIGYKFEQIQNIINKVKYSEKIGVCLDTCHVYSAGYDIVNKLDYVLEQFDNVIGINKLKMIHLNDSMHKINSKKDRHAVIGEGTIGIEGIESIVNHDQLKHLPLILETPNDIYDHEKEIELIKNIGHDK